MQELLQKEFQQKQIVKFRRKKKKDSRRDLLNKSSAYIQLAQEIQSYFIC